eukprot:scaffold5491_cov117-Isochrysis_galbana.AAC.6
MLRAQVRRCHAEALEQDGQVNQHATARHCALGHRAEGCGATNAAPCLGQEVETNGREGGARDEEDGAGDIAALGEGMGEAEHPCSQDRICEVENAAVQTSHWRSVAGRRCRAAATALAVVCNKRERVRLNAVADCHLGGHCRYQERGHLSQAAGMPRPASCYDGGDGCR